VLEQQRKLKEHFGARMKELEAEYQQKNVRQGRSPAFSRDSSFTEFVSPDVVFGSASSVQSVFNRGCPSGILTPLPGLSSTEPSTLSPSSSPTLSARGGHTARGGIHEVFMSVKGYLRS
jgi:hypothetical protein